MSTSVLQYLLRYGAAYSVQVPPTIFAATIALPNCANHPFTLPRSFVLHSAESDFPPSCSYRVGSILHPPAKHRASVNFACGVVFFVSPNSVVGCLYWTRRCGSALKAIRRRRLKLLGGIALLLQSSSSSSSSSSSHGLSLPNP